MGKSVAPKPCPQPAKGHGTKSKMETSDFVIYVYDEGRSLYISGIPIPDPFTSVVLQSLAFQLFLSAGSEKALSLWPVMVCTRSPYTLDMRSYAIII